MSTAQEDGFWAWALAAYERSGVADACLALQDDHDQQTAYLLWAAWASPSEAALAEGAALARRWETTVLAPVRQVRRTLKSPMPPVAGTARLAVRETVKAVELDLEKLLMTTLAGLAPPSRGEVLSSLLAAAEAWGDRPPVPALERLARALA